MSFLPTGVITEGPWNQNPILLQSPSVQCHDQYADLGGDAAFTCEFAYKRPDDYLHCGIWYKRNETSGNYVMVEFFPIPGTTFDTTASQEGGVQIQLSNSSCENS